MWREGERKGERERRHTHTHTHKSLGGKSLETYNKSLGSWSNAIALEMQISPQSHKARSAKTEGRSTDSCITHKT